MGRVSCKPKPGAVSGTIFLTSIRSHILSWGYQELYREEIRSYIQAYKPTNSPKGRKEIGEMRDNYEDYIEDCEGDPCYEEGCVHAIRPYVTDDSAACGICCLQTLCPDCNTEHEGPCIILEEMKKDVL